MQRNPSPDLARIVFQLLALGILIVSSFWIVRPFVIATTWAGMIAVATWPLLLRTQAWLGGRRSLAIVVMTTALILVVLVPVYLGVTSIVDAGRMVDWSKSIAGITVPRPPEWLPTIPVVGARIASRWQQLAAATPEEIWAILQPFVRRGGLWLVGQVGGMGILLVQLLLTVGMVALLYANGEAAVRGADRFARRLAGPEGGKAIDLAARAVRAVALGVVVTAILQTALVGIGLAIAGVPFVAMLVALVFVLSVAQVGPTLVLIPATIWVYQKSGAAWGTGFLVWAVVCATFDNLVRPMLIKRGADLPLILIFAGVIGGLIAFGVIGLFIGPVVLAVGYTLVVDWVAEAPDAESGPPGSAT